MDKISRGINLISGTAPEKSGTNGFLKQCAYPLLLYVCGWLAAGNTWRSAELITRKLYVDMF